MVFQQIPHFMLIFTHHLALKPSSCPSISVLSRFVDATHANDLCTRESTTWLHLPSCQHSHCLPLQMQTVTATRSIEAEFDAAVVANKCALYLRSVLRELGFRHREPTILSEDGVSAIKIVTARHTTDRSRHIDIQYFAIQDWKEAGDVEMRFINGSINPSDALTKPVGWILHSRHNRRIMGHFQ